LRQRFGFRTARLRPAILATCIVGSTEGGIRYREQQGIGHGGHSSSRHEKSSCAGEPAAEACRRSAQFLNSAA